MPRSLISALLLVLLFAWVDPVRAADSMETEIRTLATDLHKLLVGRKETAIAIGEFKTAGEMPASAGPAFAHLLREELLRLKFGVMAEASLRVQGSYELVEDEDSRLAAVSLAVQIVNKSGKEVAGLKLPPRGIFGDAAETTIFGLSVELPPSGSDKQRDEKIREVSEKKKPPITCDKGGTVVRAAAGSLFGLEVLVKKDGKYVPQSAEDAKGLAYVKVGRDEVYAVRIVNDADYDVAVTFTIDGLNVFAFSEVRGRNGKPLYACVIVTKKSSVLVKGWHRDNEKSWEFLVAEYAKSAAAEVRNVDGLGTITASFAAAWPKDGMPPADEPAKPSTRAVSLDATARGAEVG